MKTQATLDQQEAQILMYATHVFPQIYITDDPVLAKPVERSMTGGKKRLELEEFYYLFSAN